MLSFRGQKHESSMKVFNDININKFIVMNTVLLKFQTFGVCEMGEKFQLQNLNYSLGYSVVIHVQKDACFGLDLTVCMICKICGKFSGNAIFRNSYFCLFRNYNFFSVFQSGDQDDRMHTINWLKI